MPCSIVFMPSVSLLIWTVTLLSPVQEVGEGGGGEERVREMEGQLEKAAQSQEDLHGEVDRLTASLDTTTQLKTHAEDSAIQVETNIL